MHTARFVPKMTDKDRPRAYLDSKDVPEIQEGFAELIANFNSNSVRFDDDVQTYELSEEYAGCKNPIFQKDL
ncbi:hypothetical protein KUTeg_007161 [Tegillarca granosa]|uniref:Uncharacterized protein n=1 Tax=Tegillarca granosa TaxID=220873 RepID=A0ABQ9FFP2_TEGGR|nr:hypothetical protein KUTeg_007161 [Tegillarca granosa]